MSIKRVWNRLRSWMLLKKMALKTKGIVLDSGQRRAVAQYARFKKAWPELKELQRRAWASTELSGKRELVQTIAHEMEQGKIAWLPEEKVMAAEIFVQLRLGGIEITPKNIKDLGLEEKDAQALDALIKLYK